MIHKKESKFFLEPVFEHVKTQYSNKIVSVVCVIVGSSCRILVCSVMTSYEGGLRGRWDVKQLSLCRRNMLTQSTRFKTLARSVSRSCCIQTIYTFKHTPISSTSG